MDNYNNENWNNNQNPQQNQNTYSAQDYQQPYGCKTIPHRITSDHMGLTTIKIIRILTAQVTIRLRLISSLTITI